MNYFVNENIFTLNSGTEFSAVKRLKMFHNHDVEAKIVTRNYNPNLEGDLKRVNLTHEDVINMYDYFQEITNVTAQDVDVRYTKAIDKLRYHIEGVDANESLIKHAGRTIGRVGIAPATVGLVGTMDYYSDFGHTIAKDVWDRRGFKSSTEFFHPDGSLGPQVFFDQNGQPKIEVIRMNVGENLQPTMYKLLDYKGQIWRFNTENELFTFFLSELNAVKPAVIINDRPSLIVPVANVTNATAKWQFLHNIHTVNTNQAGGSRQIVDYLKDFMDHHVQQFDGIITPTEEQKREIEKYFKAVKRVIALPDTYSEPVKFDELTFELEKRDKNKIVFLGRLSAEKLPGDPIEALALLHQALPEARVEFYGYASPANVQEELDKIVEKHNLQDFVKFHGYQTSEIIAESLKTAAAIVNTSPAEAFGMNMLEAMSFGVPVVSYKVKYGAKELVENGENGYLTAEKSIHPLAQALADLLSNPIKWSDMAKAAFDKAAQFDENSAWQKWQNADIISK